MANELDEAIKCPACGAELLSEGDIEECTECAGEFCENCEGNHVCK